MANKPKKIPSKGSAPKLTPEQQSALFVKTAKELGADDGGKLFESSLKSIFPPARKSR